eukprot:COSAG02_NODE_46704_length_346_cov_123.404858_1_plen_34_part_01
MPAQLSFVDFVRSCRATTAVSARGASAVTPASRA